MPMILVIDDDRATLHLIREAFNEANTTVVTASTAKGGLEMIPERHPDLVLLDVMLPDMSGIDAFQKIKALDARLPVIFITASGSSDGLAQVSHGSRRVENVLAMGGQQSPAWVGRVGLGTDQDQFAEAEIAHGPRHGPEVRGDFRADQDDLAGGPGERWRGHGISGPRGPCSTGKTDMAHAAPNFRPLPLPLPGPVSNSVSRSP